MTIKEIIQQELNKHKEVAFEGYCHDYDVKVHVLCTVDAVVGGAAYKL